MCGAASAAAAAAAAAVACHSTHTRTHDYLHAVRTTTRIDNQQNKAHIELAPESHTTDI